MGLPDRFDVNFVLIIEVSSSVDSFYSKELPIDRNVGIVRELLVPDLIANIKNFLEMEIVIKER